MHTYTHTDEYMAGCFSPKCVKVIQEKDSHRYWNNRLSLWNKINLVPYHTSYRKLIRAKILKLLHGHVGEKSVLYWVMQRFLEWDLKNMNYKGRKMLKWTHLD